MPGELGLYSDMTGLELLDLMSRLSGARRDTGYRLQLADRLELARADLRRPLRAYSTGMKRKLGLIQALQADPPLLILDEPTEGLDPLVQRALHELLFELRGRGRTVFMSSHVLSEVERLCDRDRRDSPRRNRVALDGGRGQAPQRPHRADPVRAPGRGDGTAGRDVAWSARRPIAGG